MKFRSGTLRDIAGMHRVRLAVRENMLSRPDVITPDHYREMIEQRGKTFVCEIDGVIVGFSAVDGWKNNVWALFVDPAHERRGIGKELLGRGMGWLCARGVGTVWLTTQPGSRAERFYVAAGWTRAGLEPSGEVRFEWEPIRTSFRR